MENWDTIYNMAKQFVLGAGSLLRSSLHETLEIKEKTAHNDLVTQIDKKIERYLVKRIHEQFPRHSIVGEEGNKINESNSKVLWLIDPIDGTINFIKQKANFAISLAVSNNGVGKVCCIYDVTNDELFHCLKKNGAYVNDKQLPKITPTKMASSLIGFSMSSLTQTGVITPKQLMTIFDNILGIRSMGSASLQLAYVSASRLDAYIAGSLRSWDVLPGQILVEEVNGIVQSIRGEELNIDEVTTLYAGNRYLLNELKRFYN